jgi:hypothetical protein
LDTTDFGVNASKQCLSVSMIEHEDKLEVEFVTQLPFHKPALKAVSCFDKTNYACELRVQTVTYFAWFVANWFSVLLVRFFREKKIKKLYLFVLFVGLFGDCPVDFPMHFRNDV